MQDVIEKLKVPAFKPLPIISGGKAQTIASYCWPYSPSISNSTQHVIELYDGDKLVVIENKPAMWHAASRIVLLVHGLAGSHLSKYIIRMANLLIQQGFSVIRMNLRGCGAGRGLAKHPYHCGRSEDARAVIQWISRHYPLAPITQVGFSLGANITLKMSGEDGAKANGNLDSIVAVSPPLDMYECVKLLMRRENWLFNRYFVTSLLKHERELRSLFPQFRQSKHAKPIKSVMDFDELVTAPRSGFSSAVDYYRRCSSGQFLEHIRLPTFILHALDDPFISGREFKALPPKKNVDVLITREGGHVAWLGHTQQGLNYRWMDTVIAKWINWFDGKKTR